MPICGGLLPNSRATRTEREHRTIARFSSKMPVSEQATYNNIGKCASFISCGKGAPSGAA
jgi:hypothetical protein